MYIARLMKIDIMDIPHMPPAVKMEGDFSLPNIGVLLEITLRFLGNMGVSQ
jgi:hypothetical protein